MLGQKIREYRETKGLLQREVAAELRVDTAYVSKMESSEKPVSKGYLKTLAKLYGTSEAELLTLWLADKVFDVVKDESVGLKAINFAEEELMKKKKNKQ